MQLGVLRNHREGLLHCHGLADCQFATMLRSYTVDRSASQRPAFRVKGEKDDGGSLLLGGLLLGADVEVAEDEGVLLVGNNAEPVT